jgi:hypothetical protein
MYKRCTLPEPTAVGMTNQNTFCYSSVRFIKHREAAHMCNDTFSLCFAFVISIAVTPGCYSSEREERLLEDLEPWPRAGYATVTVGKYTSFGGV